MNSIERVFASLSGNRPDRVPVSLTASLYGAALLKSPLEDYFRNADIYAEGQILVASQTKTDVIFSPFIFPMIAGTCGAKTAFRNKFAPPAVISHVPYIPGEKVTFSAEDMLAHPVSEYLVKCVRNLRQSLGDQKVITAVMVAPCDLPALVFGTDKWLHTLLFFREAALSIIRDLGEYFTGMLSRMYDAGAHAIAFPLNFTNLQLVTPEIASSVLPEINDMLMKSEGPKIFHHGGVDLGKSIVNYTSLPGCVMYVLSSKDNIKNIRQYTGNKTLLGNIDSLTIKNQTTDAIKGRCRKILDANGGDTRFLLGTSNADIPYDTPIEKLLAITESAEEYAVKK